MSVHAKDDQSSGIRGLIRKANPFQIGLGRRDFIKIGLKAAVGTYLMGPKILGTTEIKTHAKKETNPETIALNYILSLPLGSEERRANEQTYVKRATTLDQIDHGFFAIAGLSERIDLFEKRWKLREAGHPNLRKLTPEEETWATKHNIHPEFLAVCTDSYFKAREMLSQKMQTMGKEAFLMFYRPDLVFSKKLPQAMLDRLTVDDILPNPGTMVGIILHETGMGKGDNPLVFGGVNIGNAPSIKLLRNDKDAAELKSAREGLINLYDDLNKISKDSGPIPGLTYVVNQVPGAVRTVGSPISGGDIGAAQFRPNTAWLEHQFLRDKFNFPLHPMSLDAITAAFLVLGRGLAWMDKQGQLEYRFGYINSASKSIDEIPHKEGSLGEIEERSLEKWNGILASGNLDWGRLYQHEIIEQGIFSKVSSQYLKKAA